jgi:hypothetical protein
MILVGLEDVQDRTQIYDLPHPAELLVTSTAGEVDPSDPFEIRRTNLWKHVNLHALDPPPTFAVRIRSTVEQEGVALQIATIRPLPTIEVDRLKIQGLGLETATVTVTVEGLQKPEGHEVTVSAPAGGKLSKTSVLLNANGVAQTELRSIAIGSTQVEAIGPQLAKGTSKRVEFVLPWLFLGAAILGGAVGAAIRRAQNARKKPPQSAVALDIGVGSLNGILVAVLYAIGINLLPVTPVATAGEALVFGLAAFGGFMGFQMPSQRKGATT